MKKYKVIDLQGCAFMSDTHDEPLTANELRSRFWGLDDCRTTKYKHFTANHIQEVWGVDFVEVKEMKAKDQKKITDEIDKEIKEYMKSWLDWFPGVAKDIDAKEPKDLLKIDTFNEYDNFYYSQGFVRGMQEVKRIIERA